MALVPGGGRGISLDATRRVARAITFAASFAAAYFVLALALLVCRGEERTSALVQLDLLAQLARL
eukprot:4372797-Pleurochrysis_carterae.AAC.2